MNKLEQKLYNIFDMVGGWGKYKTCSYEELSHVLQLTSEYPDWLIPSAYAGTRQYILDALKDLHILTQLDEIINE